NRKALTNSFWRAGKIDDQTSRSSAANTARNHTHACVLERFSSHRFRQPGCFTFNYSSRSFWGVIARTKASTTSGNYQVGVAFVSMSLQQGDKRFHIVCDDLASDNFGSQLVKES